MIGAIKIVPSPGKGQCSRSQQARPKDSSEGHILSQRTGSPLGSQTGGGTSQDSRYPRSPISTKGQCPRARWEPSTAPLTCSGPRPLGNEEADSNPSAAGLPRKLRQTQRVGLPGAPSPATTEIQTCGAPPIPMKWSPMLTYPASFTSIYLSNEQMTD